MKSAETINEEDMMIRAPTQDGLGQNGQEDVQDTSVEEIEDLEEEPKSPGRPACGSRHRSGGMYFKISRLAEYPTFKFFYLLNPPSKKKWMISEKSVTNTPSLLLLKDNYR